MDKRQVDRVFKLVAEAAGQMQLRRVDEAFASLEDIRGPNLDEWPLAISEASSQLRAAKDLADKAEAAWQASQPESARELWRKAEAAVADARVHYTMKMSSHVGARPVEMEDAWPTLVRAFEEYLRDGRRRTTGGA